MFLGEADEIPQEADGKGDFLIVENGGIARRSKGSGVTPGSCVA